MIEGAIISRINSGSYTYVDTGKIFVNKVAQNISTPYCFLVRITTNMVDSKDVPSHADNVIVRMNIVSTQLQTCENWSLELRDRLDGLRGYTSDGSTIGEMKCTGKDYLWLDNIDSHAMSLEFTVSENM